MKDGDQRLEREFDELLARYRNACEAPEASANFMPLLWERIEGRRSFGSQLRRWTEGFVAAAAAACVMMLLLQVGSDEPSAYYQASFVESLAEDNAPETLVVQEAGLFSLEAPAPDPATK